MSQEMFVQPAALAQVPSLSPVLRKACLLAVERSGLSVGSFLQGLSDSDIDHLLEYGRLAQTSQEALMGFSLFSIVLANGEGLVVTVQDNLSEFVRRVILLLQAEMLFREGLVVLPHPALTLEHFDIRKLAMTAKGQERFGGISVTPVNTPAKDSKSPGGAKS